MRCHLLTGHVPRMPFCAVLVLSSVPDHSPGRDVRGNSRLGQSVYMSGQTHCCSKLPP